MEIKLFCGKQDQKMEDKLTRSLVDGEYVSEASQTSRRQLKGLRLVGPWPPGHHNTIVKISPINHTDVVVSAKAAHPSSDP